MDFRSYLRINAQKVEEQLNKILSDFLSETKKTNIKLSSFAKSLVNSCRGGKRIRGVLVKLGYELAQSVILNEVKDLRIKSRDSSLITQNDSKEILKVGAAFEILHTALLIHDDIIDQSPQRRGQPSLYMALGGGHLGISQAISLGDIGLYLPIKIITKTSFSAESKLKALNYFSQILINTGWGQMMDVEKSPDINFVNLFKTAKYTIAGPLQIGAILAGADENLVKKLGEFGENAGLAFQIQDDILDGESKAVDQDQAKALEYASRARKVISRITKDTERKKLLRDLTEYLVERQT